MSKIAFFNRVPQLKAVSQLCNMLFQLEYHWLHELNGSEDDLVGTLKDMSLRRDETVVMCQYGNTYDACEDRLTETVTEEGICYTFNMMSEREIFRKSSLHTEYN